MWVFYEILHTISESKEGRFCWSIHVAPDAHGKLLYIMFIFNSDMHEAANPVIQGSSM